MPDRGGGGGVGDREREEEGKGSYLHLFFEPVFPGQVTDWHHLLHSHRDLIRQSGGLLPKPLLVYSGL